MIWEAHVYLQRQPSSRLDYVGPLDLDGAAATHNHVKFAVDGKTELGLIELIDPPDWQDRGVIPKVHISLSQPA